MRTPHACKSVLQEFLKDSLWLKPFLKYMDDCAPTSPKPVFMRVCGWHKRSNHVLKYATDSEIRPKSGQKQELKYGKRPQSTVVEDERSPIACPFARQVALP
jgi:hypothetical protein